MNTIISSFDSLTKIQKILVLTILATVVYFASTSITFSILKGFSSKGTVSDDRQNEKVAPGAAVAVEEDANDPKTETCPLNGSLKSKRARDSWEKRRPLAVMIENHTESRPQSGLSSADIVYEAVAEGGITRFMALFYCNLSDIQVGPVRSARTYFLDWLGEYDALYAHVGGANTPGPADALGQIIRFQVKDLNQFSIGFPVFWRDYQRLGHPVATEHTMYSTTQKLWEVGAKRGWVATDSANVRWDKNFVAWKFKDEQPGGTTAKIEVNFWENQTAYQVMWDYDVSENVYRRKNGGESHNDLNNKKQISPKTVIVQFQKETNANDGYPGNVHLLYGTTGSGKVLIFQDGKINEGKWVKQSRTSRTKFVDASNKEVELNKGQIWIQTVPEGSKVTY